MLNPGKYSAVAKSGILTQAKTGTWQVSVLFEVCSVDGLGEQIHWYGYLTEKSRDRTIETLRTLGWTGTDFSDLSELETHEMPVVELVVEHESYNGRLSAKVKYVNEEGSGPKQVSTPEAAKFAASLRGAVLAHDQRVGAPKKRTAPAPAAFSSASDDPPLAGGDDDIPF